MGSLPATASVSASSIASAAASRRRDAAAGDLDRALAEQLQVAHADGPARAAEQREQGGVGGEVLQQGQRRHHVGDLGQLQQPLEPDDLDGDVGAAQGLEDVGGVGVVAGEHGDLAPAAHPVVGGLDLVGQPSQLLVVGLEHLDAHLTLVGGGVGQQPERGGRGARRQRLGDDVGQLEDGAARAAVGLQGELQRLGPGSGREGVGEAQDVGHRRASPAVDRLVGVADGHHRVTAAVLDVGPGEEGGQHQRLGDRGVLVLVEEDDVEPLALQRADVGAGAGQRGAERDLVGELHQPQRALQRAVVLDQRQQLLALVDHVEGLLQVAAPGHALGLAPRLLQGLLDPRAAPGRAADGRRRGWRGAPASRSPARASPRSRSVGGRTACGRAGGAGPRRGRRAGGGRPR